MVHPCGILVSLMWQQQFSHIKGNNKLVLMHHGIVNGYYLLCYAHTRTIPEHVSFHELVIMRVLFLSWVLVLTILR